MPKLVDKDCTACGGTGEVWQHSSWLEQDVRFNCDCLSTPEELQAVKEWWEKFIVALDSGDDEACAALMSSEVNVIAQSEGE